VDLWIADSLWTGWWIKSSSFGFFPQPDHRLWTNPPERPYISKRQFADLPTANTQIYYDYLKKSSKDYEKGLTACL
jgi:hypothetical protein